MQNIKPVLKVTEGKPLIRFIALRNIDKDEELYMTILITQK